jgi:hypothetical protein
VKYYSSYLGSKIEYLHECGYFQRSRSRTSDEEVRDALVLVAFREGKARARASSISGQRPPNLGLKSESSSGSPSAESSEKVTADSKYQQDSCHEMILENGSPAALAEDIEDLKSMRSLQFTVFD